jgi:SM-20-related protein
MQFLDLEALSRAALQRAPYDYLVLPGFVRPEALPRVSADFPEVPGPGSHPPGELSIKGAFKDLIEELLSPEFQRAIEHKFGVDLHNRPTMYTVRGFIAERDGEIHTDSKSKIITVLLYLNEGWEADGGRLRVLRGPDDLDNFAAEVPPHGGFLLAFRRSDSSWHGHKKHTGPRRVIQLNWVMDQSVVDREQNRHRFSTRLKWATRLLFGRKNAA